MRILHTADWHLGAKLGVHERTPDHRTAIRRLLAQAEEAGPDLIIHAGDVWDGFHPSHEALHLGLQALSALGAIAPTIVIRGNHDSARLFDALAEVMAEQERSRVVMVTEPELLTVPTERADTAIVMCMPFLTLAGARSRAPEVPQESHGEYNAWIRSLNAKLAEKAAKLGIPRERTVYAAHLYVAGCRPGRSERAVTVTDDYATEGKDIPTAGYAAFGHIHDAQRIGDRADTRYAGALVRMSFQERESRKTTALAVTGPDGATVEELPNDTGRDLVDFEGTIAELEQRAHDGALNDTILRARVTSPARIYNIAERIWSASPKVRVLELVNRVDNPDGGTATNHAEVDESERPIQELFGEWRRNRLGEERENDETAVRIFAEAVRNGQAPGTSDFGLGRIEDEFDALRAEIAHRIGNGSRIANRTTPTGGQRP